MSALPQFSNEQDWEMASFELKLVLDRVWPHKQAMNISDYLHTTYAHHGRDIARRADSLIYFALTLSAKKDSYAKLQISAACHTDAVPSVMRNERKKLLQMFESLFTMTTLHTANLPSMRKQCYDISQKDMESVLAYTSRVDVIVATMAKLGEQVSPGAWIYALGNGLRSEYIDSKDGILYNKQGYETVLSVKTKILSEEAILKDKRAAITKELVSTKEIHDEIAMKIAAPTPSKAKPPTDQAQCSKGKDGKKGGPKGQRQWVGRTTGQNEWTNWQLQQSWTPMPTGTTWQPLPQKGKGKQPFKTKLWCDIHQAYGHFTDWCFENPHRSGGPPKQEWNPYKSDNPATQEWCDNHQTYGHSTEACRKGNGQAPPPQQQGHPSHTNAKGGKGKTKGSSRSWKSDNFPADYDQATPALQTTKSQVWWETDAELSSVCMHSESINLKLSIFDDDEQHDDELDEDTATLLDLHFVSII
jgi:hypothetical protein